MKIMYNLSVAAILIFGGLNHSFAQGKYFGVFLNKQTEKNLYGKKVTELSGYVGLTATPQTVKTGVLELDYPGKTQKQLSDAVLSYIKSNTYYVLKSNSGDSLIHFRDFALIGTKEKCMADLTALTIWSVHVSNNAVYIGWSSNTIYASVFGAKLNITRFDEVVSEDDAPFNYYQIIQPSQKIAMGQYRGVFTKKPAELKGAYPESVYDPEGNIVNAENKKIIENFYDGFVTDLDNYLHKTL